MGGDFPPDGLERKLQVGCTFPPGDWGLEVHVADELSPICPRWLVAGAADEQGLPFMLLQMGAAGGQYLPSGWLQVGARAGQKSSTYFRADIAVQSVRVETAVRFRTELHFTLYYGRGTLVATIFLINAIRAHHCWTWLEYMMVLR